MPFSAQSLDFLAENMLNDSRVWYNEHKEDYKKLIVDPFAEFVTAMTETMLEIDDKFECMANKAYLPLESSAPARISFDFGTETGIRELKGENENVKAEIYDLSGRKVENAQKGIFIVNGKKVIK